MILTILALATAQTDPPLDCNHPVNQLEMAQCGLMDYRDADADLNRQWQRALISARQFDRENADSIRRGQVRSLVDNLRTAQRAWITYRDAHCDAEGRNYFGEATRYLIINKCLRELTEMRTQQLGGFIEE